MRDANVYESSAEHSYDQGLRVYMSSVFNYMAMALGFTGLIAFFIAQSTDIINIIYGTGLMWVVIFAPVILSFVMATKVHSLSFGAVRTCFWVYAGLMGVSLSFVFHIYTGESIARVFFMTAVLFGVMAIYGNQTKKDLTSMASFLFMGVIGIIIASVVNIFLHSSALHFAVSLLSIIIFTGLTAYEVQNLKRIYYNVQNSEMAAKYGIMGALSLYINFINIFINLLQFFGDRK